MNFKISFQQGIQQAGVENHMHSNQEVPTFLWRMGSIVVADIYHCEINEIIVCSWC
jgi:hypothetical protein